jgi:hypothetical protein
VLLSQRPRPPTSRGPKQCRSDCWACSG